jgi:hypothetical protein
MYMLNFFRAVFMELFYKDIYEIAEPYIPAQYVYMSGRPITSPIAESYYLRGRTDSSVEQMYPTRFGATSGKSQHIVIRDESGGKKYKVFNNIAHYESFLGCCPESARIHHEVIVGVLPQRIRFDIDAPSNISTQQQRIFAALFVDRVARLFSIWFRLKLSADSIAIEDANGADKFSLHIKVIPYLCPNNQEVARFATLVRNMLPDQYVNWVDWNVYKSTQNFRMPFSHKLNAPNRTFRLVPFKSGSQLLIADLLVQPLVDSLPIVARIEVIVAQPSKKSHTIANRAINIDESQISALLRDYLVDGDGRDIFSFKSINGAIINFDRLHSSYCEFCARVHELDNTLFAFVNLRDELFAGCIKKKGYHKFVCTLGNI